jgi:hypothetical protein
MKPIWRGFRQSRVRRNAPGYDVDEKTKATLPASRRKFGNDFIHAKRLVERRMNFVVIAGEENVAVAARCEQRRREDMIETKVLVAPKMSNPGDARSGQQRVKIVYFRREQFPGLVHHRR